jgi:hypothetical protein
MAAGSAAPAPGWRCAASPLGLRVSLDLSIFREAGIKRHSAVDKDACARYIVGLVGRKPDDRPADVCRLAKRL